MEPTANTQPILTRTSDAPIGIFDSGFGGLTVARDIAKKLPNESLIYLGDSARGPYGPRPLSEVDGFVQQIGSWLVSCGVKMIVIACNTASALALDAIEGELDIPILGVLRPGAKVAAETTKNKRVGVIATESTIRSGMYGRYIKAHDPEITVYGKACPLFVPLVEEGWLKDPVTEEVARRYLKELLEKDIDSLILGCTHYPLIRSLMRKIVGDKVQLVNPAYETALELGRLLTREGLANDGGTDCAGEKYQFFVSDAAEKFAEFANSILPYDVKKTRKINIEEYGA